MQPIDAPGNVIVVSMPSLLDPSLAPTGRHVIHAYTAVSRGLCDASILEMTELVCISTSFREMNRTNFGASLRTIAGIRNT
jgi:phytoene dehydrogenase-like protein